MADAPDPKPRGRPRDEESGGTVSSWIPSSLHQRLVTRAKESGRTICDFVRDLILEGLADADHLTVSGRVAKSRPHVYVGGPPSIRLKRMQFNQETRARRLGIAWEMVDLRRVYHKSGGLCGICGHAVNVDEFTVDHIVPVSRGGPHVLMNLQAAHALCNSAKGDR